MRFELAKCIEPSKSIPSVSSPADVKVCFTIEELMALASDFHSHSFEFDDSDCSTPRNLEMRKRDINIMLKLLYAIEAHEEVLLNEL